MIEYILANSDSEYTAAAKLFKEYAVSININLDFQHFEEELQGLPQMYSKPAGGIILAKANEAFIGCVAIRKIDLVTGELKRMYIRPAFQRQGIGRQLLVNSINLAKQCNYSKLKLDTLNYMLPAIQLYTQAGFYEIPAYYYNPIETALYFEKLI